jgi:hypothetical protein
MFANIPQELRDRAQWVVWRYEDRNGSKPTKVPYSPCVQGLKAEVNNPQTWASFEFACDVQGFDGIGFVLTKDDPYCFIDLDEPKAEGEELAKFKEAQQKISAAFATYQEISPSGKGLHIIARGAVPVGINKRKPGVEMYSELRYMTMTGNVYRNDPIGECQQVIDSLYGELAGQKDDAPVISRNQTDDDSSICDRAYAAKNGHLFIQLFKGEWQGTWGSQSDADQALMNILAFYTQNHQQLARIFHMSVLGKRDKAYRKDYLQKTIDKALDQQVELINIDALIAEGNRILTEIAREKAELEQKRLAGIERQLREHHERNAQIAKQQIEQKEQEKADTPFTIAPAIRSDDDFDSPPGLLGEIAKFMYAQSAYPLPRTALTASIAFLSAICGRAFNVNGLGCNLYLLLVAPTGTGKEAMAGGISKLANAIGEILPGSKSYFGADQIASGQALYAAIKERKSCLSIQTEFGIELQNLTHPRAPSPIKLLKKAYLELFTKSGEGQYLGASLFADKLKNTESIQSPALTLLGETAPVHLWDALNETMMADGLLPRFTLIEQDSGSETYNAWAHTTRPSQDLLTKIATLMTTILKMDHMNRAVHVLMDAEAQHLNEQYRSVTKRALEGESKESARQVWSRAHVKAMKLAALVAIGNNPFNPMIDAHAYRWAVTIINDGTKRMLDRFERGEVGEGDARQTADAKKFLRRYVGESATTLPKHTFDKALHNNKIISYSYLRQNLIQLAAFRLGVGGSSQSFMRCVQSLCFEGCLKEIDQATLAKYGTSGKLYAVMDVSKLF